MGERLDIEHRIDARLAAWISSSSPCAAGYYLYSGASLPGPKRKPETRAISKWGLPQDQAEAEVLRECYRTGLLDPCPDRVQAVAVTVEPEPETRDGFLRDAWKSSIAATRSTVCDCLRYGPTATFSGGEALFAGGDPEAQVSGMKLRQWIDLLWRHPDGSFEAILVDEEQNTGRYPMRAEEDWRCILAAAIVLSAHRASPRVHLIRISARVVQTVSFRIEEIERKIADLARNVSKAKEPRDCDKSFTYPISVEAVEPLQRGMWPGAKDIPPGRSR